MEDVKIAIKKIKELEFSYQEPSEEIKNKFKRDSMRIGVNLNFNINEKEEMFDVIISITYEYIKGEQVVPIMKFRNITEFHLLNMKTVYKRVSEDKFHMPDNLMAMLVSVSVSSARGMIASKIAGSFISQFHLPIINSLALVKKYAQNNDGAKIKPTKATHRVLSKTSKASVATVRRSK